jgi:hypothetical protein
LQRLRQRARCLVGDRFDAAIGLVDQEPAT